MKPQTLLILGAVGVVAVAGVVIGRKASAAAAAVTQSVTDGARRIWYGPSDSGQAYLDSLKNPDTNPNNVNPNDLIPAGYRVNQWGGLEQIFTSGGGGQFNGHGATGGW